jgi:hypothetical protein
MPPHATATAMHFPADASLIFLTDELTNDRFLVDTGATFSIISCSSSNNPSGPLLKGANGKPIPTWGFITKTVQFQGKMFTSSFLQATVAVPILGIKFLQKFRVTIAPEISQILFHAQQWPLPPNLFYLLLLSFLLLLLLHRVLRTHHLLSHRRFESLK